MITVGDHRSELRLYGLDILIFDGAVVDHSAAADLIWQKLRTDQMPSGRSGEVRRREDGWFSHLYGPPGRINCEFLLSPDGRRIVSRSRPGVHDQDLLALFAEPVMRSVFRVRGLLSFHGAALSDGASAILLVGAKGAGKSTLAGSLIDRGWKLLSDDLARIERDGPDWLLMPGVAQLRMTRTTARARGHEIGALPRRWVGGDADDDPAADKLAWQAPAESAAVPLRRIYLLQPRGGDTVVLDSPPPAEQLKAVIGNISDAPPALPPVNAAMLETAAALISDVPVSRVRLPDRMESLAAAAERVAAPFHRSVAASLDCQPVRGG